MYLPETEMSGFALMFVTMLCWGSWANTQKLANWRFELFYWDYVFSVLVMSIVFAFTLGSMGHSGLNFLQDLAQADHMNFYSAMLGGVVFNIGNLLLVGAIALAGMAVAFPVGIGIALLMGTTLNYLIKPQGDFVYLSIGVGLILAAVLFDAIAYKKVAKSKSSSLKGIIVSVLAGVLIGLFYPLVARSMEGAGALGPYTAMVFFCIGVFICNIPLNAYLMRKPLHGTPVKMSGYFNATRKQHLLAWLGGFIWCTGMVLNLVSAQQAGPAIAYAFGQGATLVAAVWGVFVWREFKGVKGVNYWLALMFTCYILGLFYIYQSAQTVTPAAIEKYEEQDFENSYIGVNERLIETF
jgi:glucose uptake protein